MPPAQTSRSDCAASAVSVSRLTDRRRQRGPSAGAAAHAARHLSSKIRTPGASLGVRSIEARQILARFSDASLALYLFLEFGLEFGAAPLEYRDTKLQTKLQKKDIEAMRHVIKKNREAFPSPLQTSRLHRPKLDPREIAPSRRPSGPSCMSVPEASPAHRSPLG